MLKMGININLVQITAKLLANTTINIGGKVIKTYRGVLQGSFLSPTLFNIYFDDLLRELEWVTNGTLAYADDLVIVTKNRISMISALNVLERWCEKNSMQINKKKSAIMVIKVDRRTPIQYATNQLKGIDIVESY